MKDKACNPGERFGRLLIVGDAGFREYRNKDGKIQKHRQVDCICDCGKKFATMASRVMSGETASCGCLRSDMLRAMRTTHGYYKTPIFRVWLNMLRRCQYPRNDGYHNYGGRGISVCKEWMDAGAFCDWAMSNGYKRGLQIDRIDNEGDYEPGNCRFATSAENNQNRRSTKLSPDIVREIRRRYATGNETRQRIAQDFGVDKTVISKVVHRVTWRNVE